MATKKEGAMHEEEVITNDEPGRPSKEENDKHLAEQYPEGQRHEAGVDDGPIVPIAHDYLREDLNEIRDKVNKLIARVNNL